MTETLKKLSEEIAQKMAEAFASAEVKSVIEQTKAASETGSFEVIISTSDIDRQGEIVNQGGADLKNYLANPVVLWGHDYYSLPIGICDSIELSDGKLIARGKFAPADANPFAQQVRRLYDLKIVRATSIGFIPREFEGKEITKWEMLEFSFVPVPANPHALSLSQAKELDLNMVAMKGIRFTIKAEGDTCTMDDGTEGVYDAEGVCVVKAVKAVKAEGDTCELEDGTEGVVNAEGTCVAKPVAEEPKPEPTEDEKVIADYYEKAERKEKDAQQIGAILAQTLNGIELIFIQASKLILDIYNSEYGQSVAGKAAIAEAVKSFNAIDQKIADFKKSLGAGEGEEKPDGAAPKERSETAGDTTLKGLNDFLMVRDLLRVVSNATTESLERVNKKIREEKGRGK